MSKEASPQALLMALSETLGLDYQGSDWGIINADGARLEAFLAFYEAEALASTLRWEMAELIFASANERLLNGGALQLKPILTLAEGDKAIAFQVDYWSGLYDNPDLDFEEFPLGEVLRAALGHHAP